MVFPSLKDIKASLYEMGGTLDELLDRFNANWFERAEVASWRKDGIPDEKIWEYLLED